MSTEANATELHDDDVHDANYQPPPVKTIEEIMAADQEDESLRRYKEALLGEAQAEQIVVEPNNERKVIVKKLALVVEGRDDMELDLTGDLSQLKKQVFVIKEGVQYKVRIDFIVQREIVHGLKYVQKTYRMGVPGTAILNMSIEANATELHDDDVHDANYQPPPVKTIEEIMAADQEDESLRRYKEALLGEAQAEQIVVEPNNERKVIVKKLALVVEGRDDMELDLTGDLSQLKKQVFVIKEGVQYKVRIDFIVQREIVHGLKYVQKTYRMGVPVDKMIHMVGSYPPKKEIQFYLTPAEEAPSGMMARGTYSVSSLFTDDDKHVHLKWDWTFEIKKDWE